jgi:hypothetical protein
LVLNSFINIGIFEVEKIIGTNVKSRLRKKTDKCHQAKTFIHRVINTAISKGCAFIDKYLFFNDLRNVPFQV